MSNIYLPFIAALLLVSSIQGDVQIEEDSLIEELKQWVRQELLGAIDDLKKAEENLHATVEKALKDGHEELQMQYATSLLEYHTHRENLHPECFQQGLTHLSDYKITEFPLKYNRQIFNRYNGIYASENETTTTTTPEPSCVVGILEDVGSMVYKTAKYVSSIITTLDDIINGFRTCAVTWWAHFTCIFSYIGKAVKDVYQILTGVFSLIKEMISLGEDIKEQVQRCLHPKKAEIQQRMMFALNNAQSCTRLYKILPRN